MSLAFPYTYISCPCSDRSHQEADNGNGDSDQQQQQQQQRQESEQDDTQAFDPGHARSAFSLFPPEHMLYCEECHDLKCPRCVKEEILCWYCPYCLFEAPSSTVRTEGNRCARNCFNCPICTSQLATVPVGDISSSGNNSSKDGTGTGGPFILNCNYCMWSTLDIGITFAQPTSLRAQLDRLAKQTSSRHDAVSAEEGPSSGDGDDDAASALHPTARFTALRNFYREQLTSTAAAAAAGSMDAGLLSASALDQLYASPSSLARIMNLYATSGGGNGAGLPGGLKNAGRARGAAATTTMREAHMRREGFLALAPEQPSSREARMAYAVTASVAQCQAQQAPGGLGNPRARSVAELRPMPALLRTKRSKRCAACSHILVRPEFKPTTTRYRIKLLALNYIPFVTLRPLGAGGGGGIDGDSSVRLDAGTPSQWILTMRNPLYESVSVTLAAEALTPGGEAGRRRPRHRVTILCPEFHVGKSGDVWDDALGLDLAKPPAAPAAPAPGTATAKRGGGAAPGGDGGGGVAGKVYDRGRNWVSVVLEIVPACVADGEDEDEDGDVIEVPIRVRLEWRQTDGEDDITTASTAGAKKTTSSTTATNKSARLLDEGEDDDDTGIREVDDGRREVAYWMVLGVGMVKRGHDT